jgi:hypothetical protein
VRKIENLVGNDAALADEIRVAQASIAGVDGLQTGSGAFLRAAAAPKACEKPGTFHSPLR